MCLFKRSHGLRAESRVRRWSESSGSVAGESTHAGTHHSALSGAGGGNDGGFNGDRLFGEPKLDTVFDVFKACLNLGDWVLNLVR